MNRFNRTHCLIVGSLCYLIGLYLLVQSQTSLAWGPEGLDIMMSWCEAGLQHYGVDQKLVCIPNETIEFDPQNLLTVLEAM